MYVHRLLQVNILLAHPPRVNKYFYYLLDIFFSVCFDNSFERDSIAEGQLPRGAAYLEESEFADNRPPSDERPLISPGEIRKYSDDRFTIQIQSNGTASLLSSLSSANRRLPSENHPFICTCVLKRWRAAQKPHRNCLLSLNQPLNLAVITARSCNVRVPRLRTRVLTI